jgi:hypothetical protein
VWAHTFAHSCHWYNNLHNLNILHLALRLFFI